MKDNKKQPTNKKVTIFDEPEKIDAIIKSRLEKFPKKGGKDTAQTWTPEELELLDGVIIQYITEQGLSRDRTAQQIKVRWDIALSTARKYVRNAIDRFCKSNAEETKEEQRRLWEEQLRQILQDALENGTRDQSLKAMDLLGKYYGLFTNKQDITLEGGDTPIKFEFGE